MSYRVRHPAVDREHPLRVWRAGQTPALCVNFGVGRLWLHAVWPPRETSVEPGDYQPIEKAQLLVEWRRAPRRRDTPKG